MAPETAQDATGVEAAETKGMLSTIAANILRQTDRYNQAISGEIQGAQARDITLNDYAFAPIRGEQDRWESFFHQALEDQRYPGYNNRIFGPSILPIIEEHKVFINQTFNNVSTQLGDVIATREDVSTRFNTATRFY
jgi:hypothetical protein